MKKMITLILSILAALTVAIALSACDKTKGADTVSSASDTGSIESSIESQTSEQAEGYDIILSKEEITLKKGEKVSFDVTYTNPELISIRSYIDCEDQSDVVLVSFTDVNEDKTLTVTVEGLKAGSTEITVCDYAYPDYRETVKVTVTE